MLLDPLQKKSKQMTPDLFLNKFQVACKILDIQGKVKKKDILSLRVGLLMSPVFQSCWLSQIL